ncbi:MAG: hypothetical protein LLG00_12075 [Planctomycetaceae bacterium]|nr:hypothetical protein [Planctomycetaceae bacterium]
MLTGPTGIAAHTAGVPSSQTTAETNRTQQAVAARGRRVYHERKAETAAGIGEPDGEHHQPGERDADGRRPWEEPTEEIAPARKTGGPVAGRSKDPSRQSGNLLDLTG